MKIWKLRLTLVLTLLLVGACCDPSKNSSMDDKRIKLTVIGEDSSNLSAIAKIASDYEAISNVEINIVARSFEESFSKSNQDFINDTGLYDIVLQYNFSLSPYVTNNYVYSLDELEKKFDQPEENKVSSTLFDNAWKEVGYYKINGIEKKISYPFATNTLLMIYNKEIFGDIKLAKNYKEKYGTKLIPPTTWQDFLSTSKFLSESNDYAGIAMQGATGGWLYYEWATIFQGLNVKLMDKKHGWDSTIQTPINLNEKSAVNAMNFYYELYSTNKSSFFNVDQNEQIKLLKEGKAAMGFIWSDYIYGFFSDENGNFDKRFGFSTLPGNESPLAGGAFYINKSSSNPKEAYEFIKYLMKEENQLKLAKAGLCSPMKTIYSNNEIKKLPYIEALGKSLQRGTYAFEAGIDSDLINNSITQVIQKNLQANNFDAKKTLKEISDKISHGRKQL